jgi:hypothetical protein
MRLSRIGEGSSEDIVVVVVVVVVGRHGLFELEVLFPSSAWRCFLSSYYPKTTSIKGPDYGYHDE